MYINRKIENIISKPLEFRGYEVLSIQVSGKTHTIVDITIEKLDYSPVTIDDCTTVNRVVATLLDVENIINNRYRLNVSSPGIERLLTKFEHYSRFIGKDVVVELLSPISGRKKFTGIINSVKNVQNVQDILLYLKAEDRTVVLPFAQIRKARLRVDM